MSFGQAPPPSLSFFPSGASVGSSIVITGTGYPAGDTVTVSSDLPGLAPVDVVVSPQGNFAASFIVSSNTNPSVPYTAKAVDKQNSQITSFANLTFQAQVIGGDPTVTGAKGLESSKSANTLLLPFSAFVNDVATVSSGAPIVGKVSFTDLGAGGNFVPQPCSPNVTCTAEQYTTGTSAGTDYIVESYSGTTGISPSAWSTPITITSSGGGSGSPTVQGQVTLIQTCGINALSGTLDYGSLTPGTASSPQSLTLANTGTTTESVLVSGNDWASQSGTPSGTIIPVGGTTWELSPPGSTTYVSLTSSPATMVSSLGFGANQVTNWILNIPTEASDPTLGSVTSGTVLQQTVTFTTNC